MAMTDNHTEPCEGLISDIGKAIIGEGTEPLAFVLSRCAALLQSQAARIQQQAERIAELEKDCASLIHDNAQLLKAARAEATLASEALAERDALKVDAERYFFLKRQAKCDPKMDGRHVWYSIPMRNPNGGCLIGNTLDAAIDAATKPRRRRDREQ